MTNLTATSTRPAPTGNPTVRVGLFVASAHALTAEIVADAGYDFIVVDAEHGPNDMTTLLQQLQAVDRTGTDVFVRPWANTPDVLKRLLDLGYRHILAPMIDTADHAAQLVSAVRYAPRGVRGVASGRAARWGHTPGYFAGADDGLFITAQIETTTALGHIDEIAAVDGIDALFVGPSDLAASMGLIGQADHHDVRVAVTTALQRIRSTGRHAGVFAPTVELARHYVDHGAHLVVVGVDTSVLSRAVRQLLTDTRAATVPARAVSPGGAP